MEFSTRPEYQGFSLVLPKHEERYSVSLARESFFSGGKVTITICRPSRLLTVQNGLPDGTICPGCRHSNYTTSWIFTHFTHTLNTLNTQCTPRVYRLYTLHTLNTLYALNVQSVHILHNECKLDNVHIKHTENTPHRVSSILMVEINLSLCDHTIYFVLAQ